MSPKQAQSARSEHFIYPLSFWVEAFEQYNRAAALSETTISTYSLVLGKYVEWAATQGMSGLEAMDRPVVQRYVGILQTSDSIYGRKRELSTIAKYVVVLKIFAKWLHEESALAENTLTRLRLPKVPQRQKAPLTADEIRALLHTCERGRRLEGLRDAAIILVLLDSGLRVSELCAMRPGDIAPKGGILVIGKGNKQRSVQLSTDARRAVWRYWREPARQDQQTEYLWASQQGRLRPGGVAEMLRRRSEQAGLPLVTPHRFRHTFAVNWIRAGGDVMSLKALLGHESLTMVMRYVQLSGEDLAAKHADYSPVRRLLGKK